MIRLLLLFIATLFVISCENQIGDPSDSFAQKIEQQEKQACARGECYCKTPLGNIVHGSKISTYSQSSVACDQSCSQYAEELICNNGVLYEADNPETEANLVGRNFKCTVNECEVCQLGETVILSGETIDVYSTEETGCRESCEDFKQRRTCIRGQLSGSDTYQFTSCRRKSCRCPLPDGSGHITLDGSIELYRTQNAACGTSCLDNVQLRTCGGAGPTGSDAPYRLSGSNIFRYPSCNEPSNCPCQLPGYGTIQNGGTLTLYTKEVLECGEKPEFYTETFSCEESLLRRNGVPFDPNTDPTPANYYTSYSSNCPGCNLPWGGSVADGATVNAYKFSGTVINGCGRGCKQIERTCRNGVLDGDASYDMQRCENTCDLEGGGAPPRLCLLPWQNSFVTPDAQIPVWSKKIVGCGDSCQNYYKLARCNMTTGNFDVPFGYIYQSCTEVCP